jgi:hypothetical protein
VIYYLLSWLVPLAVMAAGWGILFQRRTSGTAQVRRRLLNQSALVTVAFLLIAAETAYLTLRRGVVPTERDVLLVLFLALCACIFPARVWVDTHQDQSPE